MFAALTLMLAQAATPAPPPADRWVHAGSGVAIPRRIGDLVVGDARDTTSTGVDTLVSIGPAEGGATLSIQRAALPLPWLWMERGWTAIGERDPAARAAAPARPVGRDGLVRTSGNVALAVARAGEWLVRVRATGPGARTTVQRIADALVLPDGAPTPAAPGACSASSEDHGQSAPEDHGTLVADAEPLATVARDRLRGLAGTATGGWCRDEGAAPPLVATLLRTGGGSDAGWVAAVGDAHMALLVLRQADRGGGRRYGLWAGNANAVRLVGVYDAPPGFEAALRVAVPVLVGRARGWLDAPDP